jgi:hypothetical protein
VNGGFFDADDQIIQNLHKIKHIPCVLIQGRYNMCTPVRTTWDIHKAWPEADVRLVGDAGHTSSEPGIVHELICATDRFALIAESTFGINLCLPEIVGTCSCRRFRPIIVGSPTITILNVCFHREQ